MISLNIPVDDESPPAALTQFDISMNINGLCRNLKAGSQKSGAGGTSGAFSGDAD